jgi:hypothetical protein
MPRFLMHVPKTEKFPPNKKFFERQKIRYTEPRISAACMKGNHSECYKLNCTCRQCGHPLPV